MKPIRHQRKRTKGYKLPMGTVCVTRPGMWGNPFDTADEFRAWLAWFQRVGNQPAIDGVFVSQITHMRTISRHLKELRGKNLACWCSLDQACHADVLIELANREVAQ